MDMELFNFESTFKAVSSSHGRRKEGRRDLAPLDVENFSQKRLFSWFRVGKNKFYHFWPTPRKIFEKSSSGPPGKKSFRSPCKQLESFCLKRYFNVMLEEFSSRDGILSLKQQIVFKQIVPVSAIQDLY